MGCWNGTCGLSQLPIFCGQKCKLIFLVHSPHEGRGNLGGGFCYPTDLRYVFSFPISGEYDDYGRIENTKEDWYTIWFTEFFNSLVENKKIMVNKKEIEYDNLKFPFNLEQIVSIVERGAVSFVDWYSKEATKVDFMLILDDVYNLALKIAKSEMKKDKLCFDCFKDKPEKYAKWANEYYNNPNDQEIIRRLPLEKILTEIYYLYSESLKIEPTMLGELVALVLKNKNLLEKAIKQNSDFTYLLYFMREMRKPFIEGCGAGSQDGNLKMYRKFYEGTLKCIDKTEKMFDEY